VFGLPMALRSKNGAKPRVTKTPTIEPRTEETGRPFPRDSSQVRLARGADGLWDCVDRAALRLDRLIHDQFRVIDGGRR
jgi:hypothetical protein